MDFQTPTYICNYMVSLIEGNPITILEPTPGEGNLVKSLQTLTFTKIHTPDDFFTYNHLDKYDYIVMNPPFTPMKLGYEILYECMDMSDNIIALMPWLTMINSEKRTKDIMDFGLKSITHLPRKVFNGSRVQTCILDMKKDYKGQTKFYNFKK